MPPPFRKAQHSTPKANAPAFCRIRALLGKLMFSRAVSASVSALATRGWAANELNSEQNLQGMGVEGQHHRGKLNCSARAAEQQNQV